MTGRVLLWAANGLLCSLYYILFFPPNNFSPVSVISHKNRPFWFMTAVVKTDKLNMQPENTTTHSTRGNMDRQQLTKILSDEEFFLQLLDLETDDQLQELVKQQGITLSETDVIDLRNTLLNLNEADDKVSEVLSDDQLEEIAGGINSMAFLSQIKNLYKILVRKP